MTRMKSALLGCLLAASAMSVAAEPVDVNRADAEALAAGLFGVGVTTAEAIVAYRDAHGPFRSAEDLTQVKGIGMKLVERNRENIRTEAEAGPRR